MARSKESSVPGRLHERSMNISERLKTVNNQECWTVAKVRAEHD
jgi:hypothetical protein